MKPAAASYFAQILPQAPRGRAVLAPPPLLFRPGAAVAGLSEVAAPPEVAPRRGAAAASCTCFWRARPRAGGWVGGGNANAAATIPPAASKC